MHNEYNKKRIRSINRMLLEVASGNFSYRIERTERDDELEALIVLANMMTEELEESIRHQNYINLNESYKYIAQMTFVLDENFRVQSINPMASEMLLYPAEEILGQIITDFLVDQSREKWLELMKPIISGEQDNHTIELSFKAKEFFIVPAVCSVSILTDTNSRRAILVTAIETVLRSSERIRDLQNRVNNENGPNENNLRIQLTEADVAKIAQAKDYLTSNLREINLSLKDLARTLGTNEFKLKYGFKELYGTTIFRFVQDERLRKANLLVQHSELPFKAIAEMTGFKTAPHFSRVFKDKYGCSPSIFRKRSSNSTD
ncbi:PAS domain S-box-containing protein [Sinomicrobium oceani]|uniref:PAS domain S-box-containing protein n=1 Tax=Sinomicrobium oceani TaxID=1150368 RepID=A0A1K1NU09_9FLAO|nr:helix-turn-helix domain-containing protein [Sinomicrobium oceani]SFW37902.1 PAS domain S-box-containing protein [Sinomicrobium oceani]